MRRDGGGGTTQPEVMKCEPAQDRAQAKSETVT